MILLVDDSMMNRMMLAGILGEDYRILEAENGKQCLELLRANAGQTSLVLLDINMPVMDGFEVLRTMNTNHTIEDVPVIMISSDDSEEAIRKAYELGASDYVNAPLTQRSSTAGCPTPSSCTPSSGGWCRWCLTRSARGKRTPMCWWAC